MVSKAFEQYGITAVSVRNPPHPSLPYTSWCFLLSSKSLIYALHVFVFQFVWTRCHMTYCLLPMIQWYKVHRQKPALICMIDHWLIDQSCHHILLFIVSACCYIIDCIPDVLCRCPFSDSTLYQFAHSFINASSPTNTLSLLHLIMCIEIHTPNPQVKACCHALPSSTISFIH